MHKWNILFQEKSVSNSTPRRPFHMQRTTARPLIRMITTYATPTKTTDHTSDLDPAKKKKKRCGPLVNVTSIYSIFALKKT